MTTKSRYFNYKMNNELNDHTSQQHGDILDSNQPSKDEHPTYNAKDLTGNSKPQSSNEILNHSTQELPSPILAISQTQLDTAQSHYENIRINFPTKGYSTIKKYMVYSIKYAYKGKELDISRRFSDFTSLRNSLRNYMPGHYIFPAHKKRTVVCL